MPVLRAVARGDDPGREPSCGAPADDAYRSNHMPHSQYPRGQLSAASIHQSGRRGDRSANQAEMRIELTGTLIGVPVNPCSFQKSARKPTLYLVPLSSADINWF